MKSKQLNKDDDEEDNNINVYDTIKTEKDRELLEEARRHSRDGDEIYDDEDISDEEERDRLHLMTMATVLESKAVCNSILRFYRFSLSLYIYISLSRSRILFLSVSLVLFSYLSLTATSFARSYLCVFSSFLFFFR